MNFKITNENEIGKLLAYLRVVARGKFEVDPVLVQQVMEALKAFAKANNMSVEIVTPSDERVAVFTGSGVMAGAALGFVLAEIPGAILGAVVGGVMGFSLAHVKIRMALPPTGSAGPVVLDLI